MENLFVYNSLKRQKEKFEPIHPPFVGMYVCGPTVYGDAHFGHARSALSFDIVFRYLQYLGYNVRYVRNITDVGHLENDADEGEDKIAKFARVNRLEPMQVVQHYTNRYKEDMRVLNMLNPSIEPIASGHIPEQIEMIEKLIANGFAYESNGSVYFDVPAYSKKFEYGKLSGRNIEETMAGSRELDGQEEKRHPSDFALWKKAEPMHIMRWKSPWSEGFPGWHIECTVMSTKYLGTQYDIHGGGMDLLFPHHEGEIAQSNGCIGDPHSDQLDEAKYWLHNNMITIDGKKMGKSLKNPIMLRDLFVGTHEKLDKAYSPMTLRFFMLQTHYRSTLDFSIAALQASEKGFERLSEAFMRMESLDLTKLKEGALDEKAESNLAGFEAEAKAFMNDDFNTAMTIARMFDSISVVNEIHANKLKPVPVRIQTLENYRNAFRKFFTDVLGLVTSKSGSESAKLSEDLMSVILEIRTKVRAEKNFAYSDFIRDELGKIGISVKDTPSGPEWESSN